ncbi:MAG: hypothetical protein HC854_01035 [Flavobacterium sp.]|nr:hypothetical protein [Flavobacterium sp.]
MANFVQSFSVGMPKATITNFQKVTQIERKPIAKPFWETQLFMWLCIILGGGAVAYFAFGLLKNMKNE